MGEYRDLLYEVDDHIATITLNRPDRLNAISGPMLDSLARALRASDRDGGVRVVVITGAGRGFCSGLDLKEQASGNGIGSGAGFGRFDLYGSPPVALHTLDKPVICALNGAAAGYGMDLALGCDIRIAAEEAKLGAVFTRRGVVPESGGTWYLPRLLGWARAAEVAFTGRVLEAKECLDLGLVNQVVPGERLMEVTRSLAVEIAGNAPLAVQATKRLMRLGLGETFEANVDHVFSALIPLFGSHDFREGIAAYLEKRAPQFEGR